MLLVALGLGTFIDAALRLGENTDPRCVIRYYRRTKSRIGNWTSVLATLLTAELAGGYQAAATLDAGRTGFAAAWFHLREIIDRICERLAVLPECTRPPEPLGYSQAAIGLKAKALGP